MEMNDPAIIRPRIHSAHKQPLENLVPLQTPISAHIDISSLCNYKCSFCFQADLEGMKKNGLKRGFMDVSLFEKIVTDMTEFPEKLKKIKIGNHGEPTLHPDVIEMVAIARNSGCAEIVEMFTNGSKLEPNLNKGLIEAGLQRINISLEGLSDERYREVAGVRQSFDEIVKGVVDLYAQKKALGSELKIYVKIADHAHALKKDTTEMFVLTAEEKQYFFDTFSPHCDEIFVEKIVPQWAETQLDKQNTVGDTGMYGQSISAWKNVCPFVFMYMHFNCDGTVSPCTLDWPRKVVIGNALHESVPDIWKGQAMKELQVAMLAGQRKCVNFCATCSAPMVCVEEDLDPHVSRLIDAIDAKSCVEKLGTNRWLTQQQVKFVRKL
ncbi:MAG: radical SAM/SPASM domain-containing protein [Pseudomonadota bacterium]